jgi:arginase
MGPGALRIAGVDRTLIDLGYDVADAGDVQVVPARDLPNHPKAHNLRTVGAFTRALEAGVYEIAATGRFPDHSRRRSQPFDGHRFRHGALRGQANRPLFVLWLDAHSDFNTPATSPSGNIHGMPVAFLRPGGSCRRPAARPSLVDPRNVFQVGIRSVDAPERGTDPEARRQCLRHALDRRDGHVAAIMRDILGKVEAANGLLHVSLDVDFLDPEFAPGVGTTVPGGATFREAHLIMEMLCDSGLVSALDLVELNPFLDDRGKSARVLVELTASLFGRRIFDRPTRAA